VGRIKIAWGPSQVGGMLLQAKHHNQPSSGTDSDGDSRWSDPAWSFTHDNTWKPQEPIQEIWVRSVHRRWMLQALLRCVFHTNRYMGHHDIAVYFGRDLFPIQGILTAWAHKLRGTHIYLEGISRPLVSGAKANGAVKNRIKQLLIDRAYKDTVVVAVDTGYMGTIPKCVFGGESPSNKVTYRRYTDVELRNAYARESYNNHIISETVGAIESVPFPYRYIIRLMSASNKEHELDDEGNKARQQSLNVNYSSSNESYIHREVVERIEHQSKPFMRAVDATEDGRPILRLAGRLQIEEAAEFWVAAYRAAYHRIEAFNAAIKGHCDFL
jgi:hypothetical protein